MERLPNMTAKVTTLVRATGIKDPGSGSRAETERPDPEGPERARRRTFTPKYKLEILAAGDAAPDGEKGAPQPERPGTDCRRPRRAPAGSDAAQGDSLGSPGRLPTMRGDGGTADPGDRRERPRDRL